MARLFVSASHKSSGKTTVSIGLVRALTRRGLSVQPFKKGPDYIDPMWLGRVGVRACYNLDFNTQADGEILTVFNERSRGADISLIEGNMGLHDGVDLNGADSSAALAKLLKAPVILVIDCEGMARGIAPLVLGFQAFDPNVTIGGVILNRLASKRQEAKIVAALQNYTSIPVLGAIPRASDLSILERHIGLTTPGETQDNDGTIARLGDVIDQSVDMDRLIAVASDVAELSLSPAQEVTPQVRTSRPITVAVARDEAFGFYYADDFDALERAGAKVVNFSPLRDTRLPDADALFIGGGFPETHMGQLQSNVEMRSAIRAAAAAGMPMYAECGGLMYLSRSIRWGDEICEMCGVIEGDVVMHRRPQGSGLVVIDEADDFPWPAHPNVGPSPTSFRAHEFHHAEITNLPPDTRFAWLMRRGRGIDGLHDGIVSRNVLASFSHLRDTSFHHWCSRFIKFVEEQTEARPEPSTEANSVSFIDPVNSQETTL